MSGRDDRLSAVGDQLDPARSGAFLERMKGAFQGSMLVMMIDLGHRAELFSALRIGPTTVGGLAERTGQSERHLREWLGSMAVGGVVEFDVDTEVFALPAEHAMWLTGSGYTNLAPTAGATHRFGAPHRRRDRGVQERRRSVL